MHLPTHVCSCRLGVVYDQPSASLSVRVSVHMYELRDSVFKSELRLSYRLKRICIRMSVRDNVGQHKVKNTLVIEC